jgi:hypothetical protein
MLLKNTTDKLWAVYPDLMFFAFLIVKNLDVPLTGA